MKKRLTQTEEFEIMKLVLDKFLWIGIGIMAFGLYKIFNSGIITDGIYYIISGAFVLVLFMILIVKEYEMLR